MKTPLPTSASLGSDSRPRLVSSTWLRGSTELAEVREHGGKAFTIVELLFVIGIIAILASLLIPIVGKIHQTAYATSTNSEIDQIVNACTAYYQDFRAYPGPVSNSDIELMNIVPAPVSQSNINIWSSASFASVVAPPTLVNGAISIGSAGMPTAFFTGSENLVLGLLGGLWINPITGSKDFGYLEFVNGGLTGVPQTLVGTGPRSLGSSAATGGYSKQYTAYLPVTFPGSQFMLNGDGTPEDGQNKYHYGGIGGGTFFNSIIPVFTDQYPDHMPILFMRARAGAHGIISGPANWTSSTYTAVTDPTSGVSPAPPAVYNYDLREIIAFTYVGLVPAPAPGLSLNSGGIVGIPGQHGLQAVYEQAGSNYLIYDPSLPTTPTPTTPPYNYPVPTNSVNNAGQYFMNLSVTPTNTTSTPVADYTNATGSPRDKDGFILISAGKDRTYGTADDITNFGSVEP